MTKNILAAGLLVAVCLMALSCSKSEGTAREDEAGASSTESEEVVLSRAARSRGLPVKEQDEEEPRAEVVLGGFVYEWRTSPQKGLHVTLDFVNPRDTYERARGYLFLIASYSGRARASVGVFPRNAELDGGRPVDHKDGTHLLYRKDHQVRVFIPYTDREGYYDLLRVLVYSEDGKVEMNQTYELEITGEPTGSVKLKATLNL